MLDSSLKSVYDFTVLMDMCCLLSVLYIHFLDSNAKESSDLLEKKRMEYFYKRKGDLFQKLGKTKVVFVTFSIFPSLKKLKNYPLWNVISPKLGILSKFKKTPAQKRISMSKWNLLLSTWKDIFLAIIGMNFISL